MTQRNVAGGILVQDRDNGFVADEDLKVVTKRKPTDAEMADMRMAWKVAKHVKSNAIIYVKDGSTIRDDEVIKAADEQGIAMVFTGMRHFRH